MISIGPDTPVEVEVEPFFLPAAGGELNLTSFTAKNSRPDRYLLITPPFAEEMNKCRRMTALLGYLLAERGVGVLGIDLSGTGESHGDFADATLANWRTDLESARTWIEQRGAKLSHVLGLRFGALLAADFAANCPDCEDLLLWQPVLNGRNMMAQFLRLRIAADMLARDGQNVTVASLTRTLENGNSIEVAGYEITPGLHHDVTALDLTQCAAGSGRSLFWCQVSNMGNAAPSPADQRAIDALEQRGWSISHRAFRGETFWNSVEITTCEPLLDATVERVIAR